MSRASYACAFLSGVLLTSGRCLADDDPRFAVDRFEPSERGSEWFVNESLNLEGAARPSIGIASAYSYRSIVVESSNGTLRSPVRNLASLHAGGSLVLASRLRLAVDLPFQIFADGRTASANGRVIPSPTNEQGIGDLRASVDVRIFGVHGEAITGAVGAQLWAPTGERGQWATDGLWRVRPRAMLAGDLGPFVYGAQLGLAYRKQSELGFSAAAGLRFLPWVVVGPELAVATALDDGSTAIEALLGAHVLVGAGRVGAGIGRGFGDGLGSPSARVLVSFEWAPERLSSSAEPAPRRLPERDLPDGDRDRIPDALDACPHVVGVATSNARTNGCPPDSDGDGVDDLTDACPTTAGVRTNDPKTTGCETGN